MRFLSNIISFSLPKHKDVIIFDEINSNVISKVIPKNYSSYILKTRPVQIVVTFKIILYFFKYLKDLRIFKRFSPGKSFFKNIFWQLLCIYLKSYIIVSKPKAVITSIDNCTKFAWLSKNLTVIPFLAVQNGFRLSYDVDNESMYHCQNLFCYGEFEAEKFPSRNWTVDNFYPIGSLNASLYLKQTNEEIPNEYDILVVSCWRGNIGFQKDVEDSMNAMKLFDKEFSEYLSKKNLKAAVILRSERKSDQWYMPEIGMNEEEYYKSIYQDKIDIIDTDFSIRNVYPLINKSAVIISGFCSSVLLEAFGIGKKIMYFDYTYNDKYFIDFHEDIVFKKQFDNDCINLDSSLDELLKISYEEYTKKFSYLMRYYQSLDMNRSSQDIIRSKIDEIIKLHEY